VLKSIVAAAPSGGEPWPTRTVTASVSASVSVSVSVSA
jgi:hypothetical protein